MSFRRSESKRSSTSAEIQLKVKKYHTRVTIIHVILLWQIAESAALPVTDIHSRGVPRSRVYNGEILTSAEPVVPFGERTNFRGTRKLANVESLWPNGVFLPPNNIDDLGYSWQDSGRLSTEYTGGLDPDPYLLTGRDAMLAVKYLYGRGELFFDDVPHYRALLRNHEERMRNGLHGHTLHSLRSGLQFYPGRQRLRRQTTGKCEQFKRPLYLFATPIKQQILNTRISYNSERISHRTYSLI